MNEVWWPHDSFAHHTPGADCKCKPSLCIDCGGFEHRNLRESWCEACRTNRWTDDPEHDWSNPMAQTKTQLLKDLAGLMEESQSSTESMNRARIKIDELRADNDHLRELLARFCEQVPRGCMHVPTYLVEAAKEALAGDRAR
jgi:hypothetical protein